MYFFPPSPSTVSTTCQFPIPCIFHCINISSLKFFFFFPTTVLIPPVTKSHFFLPVTMHAIRGKPCFASLETSCLTQELNGSKFHSFSKYIIELTQLYCIVLLSLHYIFCLVAETDHCPWGTLLTRLVVDFLHVLPLSFAMNSSKRRWDEMQLEHWSSNPASTTALAPAPIKHRSATLLQDTHSTPC